jgi:poly-gamma-glutamate synthesis protein (capsule biosynthesis protein)
MSAATDSADGAFFARAPEGPVARIVAAGDVSFSGRILAGAGAQRPGPLDALRGEFRDADVGFMNLESPLLERVSQATPFASPLDAVEHIPRARITVVNAANNHVRDYGPGGLRSTIEALRGAGLIVIGVGDTPEAAAAPIFVSVNGLEIAWLACARTLQEQEGGGPYFWELDPDALVGAVRRCRPRADLVAVSIHAGYMYLDVPHPDHQRLAEALSDAGADLVLMHHAHVLQGLDVRNQRRLIAYNLGNLLFDWREGNVEARAMIDEQREGALVRIDCDRGGVAAVSVTPTWVEETLRTVVATGERRERVIARLRRVSGLLRGDVARIFAAQHAERNTGMVGRVLWFHLRRGNLRYVASQLRKLRAAHLAMVGRWLAGRVARSRS